MEPIVNPGVTANDSSEGKWLAQPKWRQFCVEDGGLLEIIFLAIKVTFVGYQFLTDFDSQNRCLYALGDLMGHCYVHFAFVFTLIILGGQIQNFE